MTQFQLALLTYLRGKARIIAGQLIWPSQVRRSPALAEALYREIV